MNGLLKNSSFYLPTSESMLQANCSLAKPRFQMVIHGQKVALIEDNLLEIRQILRRGMKQSLDCRE